MGICKSCGILHFSFSSSLCEKLFFIVCTQLYDTYFCLTVWLFLRDRFLVNTRLEGLSFCCKHLTLLITWRTLLDWHSCTKKQKLQRYDTLPCTELHYSPAYDLYHYFPSHFLILVLGFLLLRLFYSLFSYVLQADRNKNYYLYFTHRD